MLEGETPEFASNDKSLIVVYAARTPEEAHLLKNLLTERGIKAFVTNDMLAGGAGVGAAGWATQPRVAVAEEDADEARRFAVEFDAKASAAPELMDDAEEEDADWPLCPRCGARRPTRCPICETTGTDFPRSDPDYLAASQLAEHAERHACGCGSGGCSSHGDPGAEAAGPPDADALDETADAEPDMPERMVTCTTCDEPFVPEYPRRCAWCGHEFDDGYACDEEDESQMAEPITRRAMAVVFAMVVMAVGLVLYFKFILD